MVRGFGWCSSPRAMDDEGGDNGEQRAPDGGRCERNATRRKQRVFQQLRPKRRARRGFGLGCLLVTLMGAGVALAEEEAILERPEVDAAVAWYRALLAGDLEGAVSLSGFPFAFDGPHPLKSGKELRDAYRKMLPELRSLAGSEIQWKILPSDELGKTFCPPGGVRILLTLRPAAKHLAVCVDPGLENGSGAKVMGFRS